MNKVNSINWQWIAGLVLLLTISRLIPHPPNFTPLGAMAILAAATIKDLRLAMLIPIGAMLISDFFLGFHSSLLFVYSAIAVIVLINQYLLKTVSVGKLALAALTSAIIFFLITNFGAWLSHTMYPRTWDGLWQAYIAGIPFFRNTLLSNLFFTAIRFYALTFLPTKKTIQV